MHKKDIVKEVIEKYIKKGHDFFELTPSFLGKLEELEGYSERTLKRGRTEFKQANKDLLKRHSRKTVSIRKKIFKYLDENPKASEKDLQKAFPGADRQLLADSRNLWEKQPIKKEDKKRAAKAIKKDPIIKKVKKPAVKLVKEALGNKKKISTTQKVKEMTVKKEQKSKKEKRPSSGSLRQKVFTYLNENPDFTLSKLENAFPDFNKKTISNYLDQWRKNRTEQKPALSAKEKVMAYLDEHSDVRLDDLRKALPELKSSSISTYQSLWKKNRAEFAVDKNQKPLEEKPKKEEKPVSARTSQFEAPPRIREDLVKTLKDTIETQKRTIDILKSQTSILQERQSQIFPELAGLTETETKKIENVVKTFVKGMKKS